MVARKLVILIAGALNALRLFFPITECVVPRRTPLAPTCAVAGYDGVRHVVASATILQALGIAALVGVIFLAGKR